MSTSADILARRSKLSPQQRALLEKRLRGQAPASGEFEAIGRRPEGGSLPLSFAQQRLWFLDQWEPGDCFYNVPRALRFSGDLDITVMERSLTEIARRHESLRTTFPNEDGLPVQLIHPPGPVTAPVIDLSEMREDAREAEARNLAAMEAQRGFDLAAGPLMRVVVVRIRRDDHLVLFTMHHIVTDGWSMGVLVREMSALYEAFSQGRVSPLKEPPIQYADFAYWQKQWFKGDVLDRQLGYWKKQLADCATTLELPVDRPRPPEQSHQGTIQPIAFPKNLLQALKSLSKEEGATLFMALLAAFKTLLYRYTGQADLLVGTPIANRNREEIEGLIGFFVNTLVLRSRLSADATFRDVLGQVRETTLGAYANQDLPFERLVEEVQPERNLSQTPLFQVMFILQNAPSAGLDLPGVRLTAQDTYMGVSKFDLSLALTETEQGVFGGVEYNTDIFEAETVRRMAANLIALTESIVANPDGRIGDLPLLSGEERRSLREWNETNVAWDRDVCCHHMFERQCKSTPDRTALVFEDQRLSYSELNERANRMAGWLISSGIGAESRVAVCLPRSVEMVVAVLATLKAGACYVPLDPSHPADRLRLMLDDSRADLLICRAESLDSLQGPSLKVMVPERIDRQLESLSGIDLDRKVDPDNLAYIIYTSGSTGRPKGIAMPHGPLANLIDWHQRELISQAPTLQFASLGFDASFHEMFGCWAGGGSLIIVPELVRMDPQALADLIERHQIRKTILPVVMLQELASLDQPEKLSSLREVITTGEQLSVTQQVREVIGGLDLRLHNHYGPSESHVVTAHRLEADAAQWADLPSIGKAISNSRIYLLDGLGNQVPVGAVGEVYIGGECLARGYLNRADLTAEKFTPDPVSGLAGERLYRTGDLGRYDVNGNLQYLGRGDRQVKLRGHRIELGEIETAISGHESVGEAVVELKTLDGENGLVAYVVKKQQAGPRWNRELREYLSTRLPQYMLPARYVEVEKIPLTTNGKVDRQALGRIDVVVDAPQGQKQGPADETEAVILKIWERVLGREGVGVEENFFELGGHSLKATQVVSRIGKELGKEVGLRELFSGPTVRELAEKVRAGKERKAEGPAADRAPEQEFELSAGQKGIWIESQTEEGSIAYNLPAAYLIEGDLDPDAIKHAVRALVNRHESLRTRIVVREGEPRQMTQPQEDLPIEEIDARGEDGERRGREIARAEARQAFDLRGGPLVRVKLVRMGEKKWAFLMTAHHLIADGWSQRVMMREMVELYRARVEGREARLRELETQYRDFVEQERRAEGGEERRRSQRYWEGKLSGITARKRLETDHHRGGAKQYKGRLVRRMIDEEQSRKLRGKAAELGVSVYMLLLAAVKVLIYRMSGEEDVAVASPVMRRGKEEQEGQIGLYLNTVVLRTAVRGSDRLREVVERVKETVLEAMEHSGVGLEIVSREMRRDGKGHGASLYDVVVTMDEEAGAQAEDAPPLEGVTIREWGEWNDVSKNEIWIGFSERGERIAVGVNYDSGLYEEESVVWMWERLETALGRLAEDDSLRVEDLELGVREPLQLSTPDIQLAI
jgi:amino acid adenylation domain-containing protein